MTLVAVLPEAIEQTGESLPCRRYDADLWFADLPEELEVAKALCGECPLRNECLAGALDRHEPWGVWGGEILERGMIVARKRPRGRPRKDAAVREVAIQAAAGTRARVLLGDSQSGNHAA